MAHTTTNMMDSYFNSDPTGFDNEEASFHLITTDHPYMATLGLSTFTTGTLYRWWNQRDGAGNYENHKYFAEDPDTIQDKTFPSLILLGTETGEFSNKSDPIGENQFSFSAWRKEADNGAGKYGKQYLDGGHTEEWTFIQRGLNQAGENRHYIYEDIEIDEYKQYFLTPDFVKKSLFEISDGQGGKQNVRFKGITPITEVVTLNDYVRDIELNDLDRSLWDEKNFARFEFIHDIYASKETYVEWSGYVPFHISLGSGDVGDTFKCNKADWVKFKLYLYPNSSPADSTRGVALAAPTFVGPPVDPLGRSYDYKEDGRFSAFPEGSASSEVAAELDMTYNEYTGQWEAGSKNMIAVITQKCPAAQMLTADRLLTATPEEMLASPNDPASHIVWGSGSAIPLNMQNGNPMQWTPNYAEPTERDSDGKFAVVCPDDSTAKAEIRMFNPSAKPLETHQTVLLSKIDGVWFAMDFPSGLEPVTTFDGKTRWEFTYLATNCIHHFRDSGFKPIDADDIEMGLHKSYYRLDVLNSGYSKDAFDLTKLLKGGYHQFSSFDMLDSKIAGTREKGNAYSTINPLKAANGDEIVEQDSETTTGSFFGCVFPEGYSDVDGKITSYIGNRQWDAVPSVVASAVYENGFQGDPFSTYDQNGYAQPFNYFDPNGIGRDVLPFEDGRARDDTLSTYKDEGGSGVPMFTFNDEVCKDDVALTQLPADVATNASPSGDYGQPIRNVHYIEAAYTQLAPTMGFTRRYVWDIFHKSQNWLRKKYDEDTRGTIPHTQNSAFDLKPVNPFHIQFRPLKAETYAQFYMADEAVKNPINGDDDPSNSRANFSSHAARQLKSNFKPASEISKQREYGWDSAHGDPQSVNTTLNTVVGNYYKIYNSHWGLMYNVDIPPLGYDNKGDPFGLGGTKELKMSPMARLPATSRFRMDVWGRDSNEGWCHGTVKMYAGDAGQWAGIPWAASNYQPAGAFGIIGAVTSVAADESIQFETLNRIGVWSWAYTASNAQGFTTLWQNAAWGKQNDYKSNQTTGLWCKIYQAWPREDTIYDARYFAVHHFNAGLKSLDREDQYPYIETEEKKISQTDVDNVKKPFTYKIDIPTYPTSDITLPTVKRHKSNLHTGTNRPEVLDVGDKCYSDGVYRPAHGGSFDDNWFETLPANQWIVDAQRRGKLLPFKYKYKTVSCTKFDLLDDIPFDTEIYASGGYAIHSCDYAGKNCGVVPFLNRSNGTYKSFTPIKDPDLLLIMKNAGTGYKVDDTFTSVEGKGLLVRVASVAANGEVTGLEMMSSGTQFSFEPFATSGAKYTHTTRKGVQLRKGGSQPSDAGTGLEAYIPFGVVREAIDQDDKPLLATSETTFRLSIPSNAENDKNPNTDGTMPFGLEAGVEEVEATLINKTVDGRYDVFFRFHNDISHTLLGDWSGNVSRWSNQEQYIDLTITTN